jgi:hypothetical protein
MDGWFGSCPAWYDPGCLLEGVGSSVGTTVTNALQPVWIILVLVIVILLIIAFSPNVRHIVPAFL